MFGLVTEVEGAIPQTDLLSVIPMGVSLAITLKTIRVDQIGNTDLAGYMGDYAGWHIGCIRKEGSKEAHGAELERETQSVMIPTPAPYQFKVSIVEVKVARQSHLRNRGPMQTHLG